MGFGLSSDELENCFLKTYARYQKELNFELLTSSVGLNPALQQKIDEYKKVFPNTTPEQLGLFLSLIMSFADTISANNQAIQKQLPHA